MKRFQKRFENIFFYIKANKNLMFIVLHYAKLIKNFKKKPPAHAQKALFFVIFGPSKKQILLVRLSIFLRPKASLMPNLTNMVGGQPGRKIKQTAGAIPAHLCQYLPNHTRGPHGIWQTLHYVVHCTMYIYAYTVVQQIFVPILQDSCCILCRKVKYDSSHSRPFGYFKMLGWCQKIILLYF
jgi:hypothetical protein